MQAIISYKQTIFWALVMFLIMFLTQMKQNEVDDAITKNGQEAVATIIAIEKGYRGKEFAYYEYKVDTLLFKSSWLGYTLTDSVKVGDKFLVKYTKYAPKKHVIYPEKRIK